MIWLCGGVIAFFVAVAIVDIIGAAWLHHKGKLVEDVPESVKDLF